jgi:AraC-like DNA-binding protein
MDVPFVLAWRAAAGDYGNAPDNPAACEVKMRACTYDEGWLRVCASRCQVIAGEVASVHPRRLLADIRRIVEVIPGEVSISQQLMVRSLIAQALGRILGAANAAEHQDIAQAFLMFSASGFAGSNWRRQLIQVIGRCETTLARSLACGARPRHRRVDDALRIIDERFTEPTLSLQVVAKTVGLSTCHLSRLLASNTGQGFRTHLHVRRVRAARRMLDESGRSVKEVAAAVGYRSVTQLDRYFKRVLTLPPSAFRTGVALQPPSSCSVSPVWKQPLYSLRKN